MEKLKAAEARLKKAEAAMVAEMQRVFPAGTEVAFYMMHGQVNASTGTVIRHSADGTLLVLHHQAKQFSRNSHRNVPYRNVRSWWKGDEADRSDD